MEDLQIDFPIQNVHLCLVCIFKAYFEINQGRPEQLLSLELPSKPFSKFQKVH